MTSYQIKPDQLKLSEHLTYLSMRFLSFLFGNLPRKLTLFLGKLLGILIQHSLDIRKAVAYKNIKIAFPDSTSEYYNRILKNTYKHYGIMVVEFLRMPYLTQNSFRRIVQFENDTLKLLKSNQNGIIVTAHFGNWEMIQAALNLNGIKLTSVAQTQKNKGANKFITWARNKTKTPIIFKNVPIKSMFRSLETGYLGLASDQYAGTTGVNVNFFGKTTSTPKGAAIFHIKTGLPILVGFCKLQPDFTYSISFQQLKINDLSENIEEASRSINQAFSSILENAIKQNPEQYFWFHRKWR